MAIINGTPGPDTLNGTLGSDAIYGLAGADVLVGRGGSDTLYGGDGADTLNGGPGLVHLYGGGDDDRLTLSGDTASVFDGGDGSDTLSVDYIVASGDAIDLSRGGLGHGDVLQYQFLAIENVQVGGGVVVGDDGANRLQGYLDPGAYPSLFATSSVTLYGGGGDDTLEGSAFADSLFGGADDDRIAGGAGANALYGGAGNDTFDVALGDDTIEGGAGLNTVVFESLPAFGFGYAYVDLSQHFSTTLFASQVLHDIQNVVGSAKADLITGDSAANVLDGAGGDDVLAGGVGADTLYGGDGSDTASYALSSAGVVLNLGVLNPDPAGQGSFVHGAGGDAQGDLLSGIENLNGSGFADKLVGGLGDNKLSGGGGDDLLTGQGGDDTLDGGAGADTLQGGTENDTFVVDDPADRVFEKPGEGTDTVLTALAVYSLAGATNVENLTYTGAGAFSGLGNASNNELTGGSGDDTLDGLGGDDSLYGGAGNDTYIVGSGGGETTDKVFEAAGGGYDTVLVRGHGFTLAAGQEIEKLVADGAGRQVLHGNELANLLVVNNVYGNVLDGGAGSDTMLGGVGNDTFYVDDPNDSVSSGGGVDTVYTSLSSYTLAAGFGTLVLTGEVDPGGVQSATGNAQANTLIGSDGDDFLDGKGGADHLVGGLGNDVYYVDDPRDVVVEQAGQGGDSLYTSLADYTAPDNVEIVYFTSTGPVVGHAAAGGSTLQDLGSFPSAAAALFVGGAGAEQLYGGYGNDSLYGGGGHDVLNGGPGDDYIRSFTGDEGSNISGGDGTDLLTIERLTTTADLKLDLTLSAGGQALGEGSTIFAIEQVRIAGGSGNDSFTGGGLDDVLKGNVGADTLSGGGGADMLQGGAGHDRLTGGPGADTFRFDGPVAGSDDAVVDFVSGTDHVALSMTGFGIASLSDFEIVSAASGPTEAKATLVVDLAAHTLAWDADGTGAGAATLLATGAFTTSAADYILF